MKVTLIGQDIPALLPSLLADLFFSERVPAQVAVEERNPAMQDVLQRYADAVLRQAGIGGEVRVDGDRRALLTGAGCVVYAGDCLASSSFRQDWRALSGPEDDPDDPGLTDQCRVNGGIEGLLHTLRQGGAVLDLCDAMRDACPGALVITLGQPVGRTAWLFEKRGFRTYGLGPSPLKGAVGLESLCHRLGKQVGDVRAQVAGLPGFAWLLGLRDVASDTDLLSVVRDMAASESLGRLAKRWLGWYEAVPVGDVTAHAELMPAQADYAPQAEPELSESVEKRKERILHMNTVGDKGLRRPDAAEGFTEGEMAQWLLLSKAPAVRPMRLAAAVLRGQDLEMAGVTRVNRGEIVNLPRNAVIESDLTLRGGVEVPHGYRLPAPLAQCCMDIDEAARLAAQAATGDRTALRECVEIDPAMEGLDRLYCQQVVEALIRLNGDVLGRLVDDDEDEDDWNGDD